MRQKFVRLLRTGSFRLVATYIGVFTLSVLILGSVIYVIIGSQIGAEFDERVRDETARLVSLYDVNGMDALAETIRVRDAGSLDYRLEDAGGRPLAGTLPLPPIGAERRRDGWIDIAEPEHEAGSERERALVTILGNGAILAVGQDLYGLDGARRAVLVAFAWALGATLVLGLGGGIIVSAGFLGRIDAMSRVARDIMAGNLSRRIPEPAAHGELDELARTLNRMLDRIETLVGMNLHIGHNIAHDLRKPLARVLRRLETGRAAGLFAGEAEVAVAAVRDDVLQLLETFNALLRIAEIETGARRARFKPLDLARIADEVAGAFQPSAEDAGHELRTELADPLPMAGDAELLTQMVANLVENAIRHTPAGTTILVASVSDGRGRALVVSDTGPGVPEEARSRLFERFYRADAARTGEGNGLGLSLVAAIADLHDMRIEITDNAPGLSLRLDIRP
ncbi:MAG: ATP-binding protein [Ancalomicrobiaceae bacterium]|nr:ATP-binding protein [Ancalomicrobiaceae bacterium]